MARIADEQIERIRRGVSIGELVRSAGIELRRHGTNGDRAGQCPFHEDDETPSLVISEAKGLWHCFGCGRAGNAFQWVMETRGVGFREAVVELMAGIGTAQADSSPAPSCASTSCPLDVGMTDGELIEAVVDYYQESLKGKR
ncbi:MAG: hypothetical protein IT175_11870 [Acidobacteria bacterium]|nr:hypothetical protein [Acidobacteriota bacterium]